MREHPVSVRGGVIVLLGLTLLGLLGCEDGDRAAPEVLRAPGTPALAGALRAPGTLLADGLRVPAGASLVGAVLPLTRRTGYPGLRAARHWTALLLVRGRVDAVVNALARQASRIGLQPGGVLGSPQCGPTTRGRAPTFPPPPPAEPVAHPAGVRCLGSMVSREASAAFRVPVRSLVWEAAQGACSDCRDGIWPSLATVEYTRLDETADVSPTTAPRRPLTHLVTLPPIRRKTKQLALPRVGDRLRVTPDGRTIHVLAGSQPLVPPLCGGCYGTDLWLMRARDGGQLFTAYARALQRLDLWDGDARDTREEREGWRVHRFSVSNTDTGVQLELFQRSGEPDYLRLELSNGA